MSDSGTAGAVVRLRAKLSQTWRRIRAWRRLRFTPGGVVLTVGSTAVGFAAVNTGNNLLHLLLGATLGLIGVSGWFSERTIRDLEVKRETPRGVTAGQEVRIGYRVRNRGRFPSFAVEISEAGLNQKAFLARVEPSSTVTVRSYNRFARRGVYPLPAVTLSTSFPFGLFVKERDLALPGEVVIWPRADRPVQPPAPSGRPPSSRAHSALGGVGSRGEYRAMHEYRSGDDDARDIHWRTSARLQHPVVREYEAEVNDEVWVCLDTRGRPGDHAEELIEIAASICSYAAKAGRRFGMAGDGKVISPASGPGHLELVLDFLARVEFRPDAAPPVVPAGVIRPVMVSANPLDGTRFQDANRLRLA
jgi:uncharacterized protein (DUF58 family)